ncbi:unnamed protein product, partial [Anisakis simplex]|uniref:Uncharacterized protein n=1 Tax=Anisakis simplex TaxID=6269 RepID=A0A0M3KH34_ANISI
MRLQGRPLYHTIATTPSSSNINNNNNTGPVPQLTLSDDGETLCVRNGVQRSSLRLIQPSQPPLNQAPQKHDTECQAGPGFNAMSTGYHSLDRKAHLMGYYRSPIEDNPYRLTALGQQQTSAA